MLFLSRITLLLALLSIAWLGPLRAGAIDNMSGTNGFFNFTVVENLGNNTTLDNPPLYLMPTATENGNNTVTLAGQDVHSDTSEEIIDWRLSNGTPGPFMDLTANRFLTLNVARVAEGRQYDVNLLFFGSGPANPTFLTETQWLVNAGASNLSPSLDVDTVAPNGAGQYFVRFRLLPPNAAGGVLTFNSIETAGSSSVPEPATGCLAIAGVVLAAFRGRRIH
jgi:hypothetical protein